jgi:hypothetical protein
MIKEILFIETSFWCIYCRGYPSDLVFEKSKKFNSIADQMGLKLSVKPPNSSSSLARILGRRGGRDTMTVFFCICSRVRAPAITLETPGGSKEKRTATSGIDV